jgi:hypothetical protein
MNRAYQYFVFEFRGAVPLTAALVIGFWGTLFLATDITNTGVEIPGIDNVLQLLGLLALFVLLPLWLLSCFIVTQRHTLGLAQQLEAHLPGDQQLVDAVRKTPGRSLLFWLAASVFYALAFNVPSGQFSAVVEGGGAIVTLFLGQLLIWTCVGLLLAIRLHAVELFYQAGKVIRYHFFEQRNLRPFARIGMLDVAIIVGSIAISTVQSLDAKFRLENYLTALLVAVPAGAALLLRPMWSLHRRLAERKKALLEEVNGLIAALPEETVDESMGKLEMLLQRRERIQSVQTWPMDMGIWSRLVVYGLIPPLAWVAAALVEVLVSRWLGS